MITAVRKFFLASLLVLFPASLVHAASPGTTDDNWLVADIHGVVEFKSDAADGAWQTPAVGQALTGPFFLRTGLDSRIVLKHRKDEISVASNSSVRFAAEEVTETGILTRVFQEIG